MVSVLALVGLIKKRFGHYAILKILALRSPRYMSPDRIAVKVDHRADALQWLTAKNYINPLADAAFIIRSGIVMLKGVQVRTKGNFYH